MPVLRSTGDISRALGKCSTPIEISLLPGDSRRDDERPCRELRVCHLLQIGRRLEPALRLPDVTTGLPEPPERRRKLEPPQSVVLEVREHSANVVELLREGVQPAELRHTGEVGRGPPDELAVPARMAITRLQALAGGLQPFCRIPADRLEDPVIGPRDPPHDAGSGSSREATAANRGLPPQPARPPRT